ncbi:hypothetical protein ACI799_08015 [Blastococcus sp. SYSU DS0753]
MGDTGSSRPLYVFDDEHHRAFAKDYLKELLTNMREAESQYRRSLLIVVSLGALFALARENATAAVSVFSLRLEDLTPLLAIVPVITAYEFYNMLNIQYDHWHLRAKVSSTLREVYPRLDRGGWKQALLPGNSALFGPVIRMSKDRFDLVDWLVIVRVLIVTFGSGVLAVVEVMLYGGRVGWSAGSFIVVAIVCASLLITGLLTLAAWTREPSPQYEPGKRSERADG